ncbi:prepilin peptidase [Photobacterium sp. TY1-4]|uniref:prepilin peptidase n=1 Tax=Photobacterium sp. TY1-4 TaxID=2899122 RepID=UPI0021C220E9|nr:prepilin peptidase [Photobacterium sp. TY1-4]UXI02184.1 hypothetical protein NH461_05235 [Photobacterium sp. TY1-4]
MFLLLSCFSILDLTQSKVDNRAVFLFLILSVYMLIIGEGITGEGHELSLFAVTLVLLVSIPGFVFNVFGAADVKILLIISLISPFSLMLDILLYTFIAFMLYWLIAVRDTKVHAPFIPSLLVGMGIAVWLV